MQSSSDQGVRVRSREERVTMRAYLTGFLFVVITLSACGKNDASGVYVLANDNVASRADGNDTF